MRVLFGSALLVALGVTACGGDGGNRTGTGSSDTASTSDASAHPDATSTSTTPPSSETDPPLRRPKPSVPLSVIPPPIRWELVGTLPEGVGVGDRVVVAGRPAPEVEGACGAPVIRVREVRHIPMRGVTEL
jgi:hypothetical protein